MSSDTRRHEGRDPQDAEMLADPGRWPNWPFLPLIRRDEDGFQQVGVLYDSTVPRFLVYCTNLFTFNTDAETILYDTAEALLADGWEVD